MPRRHAPRRLASGSWRIRWIDAQGARRSACYATRSEALAALRRATMEADAMRERSAPSLQERTIAEVAAAWLETRAPNPNAALPVRARQARRHRDNAYHLKEHILPELGSRKLGEITPQLVAAFVKLLQGKPAQRGILRPLSPSTVQNIIITLRKMLNDAGFPVRARVKVSQAPYNWIRSNDEAARFLDACGEGWQRVACALALYAGLRRGEVAALIWGDVDFDREVIMVARSWHGPTKSGKVRTVPLPPELAATLTSWRDATNGTPKALVVRLPTGRGLVPHDDLAGFARAACARARIEPITFHQLRHTFATRVAERMPITAVRELLGHVDIATTARYAHADGAAAARDPRARLTFGTS